jgi:diguanylate cyclase (GGDEF)-like protein
MQPAERRNRRAVNRERPSRSQTSHSLLTALGWAVKRWWRQPDHFDWFSVYVRTRGLQPVWRAGIACSVAVLAALPLVVLTRPVLPHTSFAVIVAPITGTVGVMLALLWVIRWPTRRQSLFFSSISTICMAAASVVQGDPRAGLLGCTAFAVLGGYIAFFHTAPYMLANFLVASVTAAILALRLAASYDIVLAGCAWILVVLLNVAFPFAVQSLVHALGIDLRNSSLDPLTGLFNRRAFYQEAHALLLRQRDGRTYLGVAMLDLDNFKRVNDTAGHTVGDRVLTEVGDVLRAQCRPASVIGRIGGEEFVIADTAASPTFHAMAERIRLAVEAIPYPVTVSVGTASAALAATYHPDERPLIGRLLASADTAMYEAKRAGGNRIRSTEIAYSE